MALFRHDTTCFLTISGEDRRYFLQRQTTNDINQLSPEKPLITVPTSPSARILDVFTLIEEGKLLRVITLPRQGSETLTFLRSRIFFNDRVSDDDESDSMVLVNILGPDSSEFLLHLGINETLTSEYIGKTKVAGSSSRIYLHRELGMQMIIPSMNAQDVLAELTTFGAASLSPQEFETIRIQTGLPAVNHELTDEYTPLETGLQ